MSFKSPKGLGMWLFAFLLIAGLISLTSCKGKTAKEQIAEKAVAKAIERGLGEKADVDLKSGKVSIKTGKGKAEYDTTQEWPNDLPEGVPQFTMGKVRSVTRHEAEGQKIWNVFLENVESGAVEKYEEELISNDWKIISTMPTIAAEKDKLRIIAILYKDKTASIAVTKDH